MIRSPRLAATPTDDTIVGALAACHERIRRFAAMAVAVATRPEAPASERAEAAAGVVRYFTIALPLHAADEDDSVGPRVRGVDVVLTELAREHHAHDALIAPVVAACREIVAAPTTARPDFAAAAAALAAAMDAHLAREEAEVFPAVAALSPAAQAEIRAEMLARRDPTAAPSRP